MVGHPTQRKGRQTLWLVLGITVCVLGLSIVLILSLATEHLPGLEPLVHSEQTGKPVTQAIAVCLTQKYRLIEVMSLRGVKPTPYQITAAQSDADGRLTLPAISLVTLPGDQIQEIYIYKPGYLTAHYRKGRGPGYYDVARDVHVELPPGAPLGLTENFNASQPDISAISLLARLYWFAYYFQHTHKQTFHHYEPFLKQLNQQLHQDQDFIQQTLTDPNQVNYWQDYLKKFDGVLYPDMTAMTAPSPEPVE